MTDGERMVWAAAFAQASLNGNDYARASALAYEVVNNLGYAAMARDQHPQTARAREMRDHRTKVTP